MSKPMQMYIRTLSPIHIGCDEVYDPMSFVLDENMDRLTSFDPLDFFRSLDTKGKTELATICEKGTVPSLFEIYGFMRGKKFHGHEVDVCKGFIAHYKKALDIPLNDERKIQQELNNLTISRTAFNPNTNQPYIPGSAIKGVLRTAYLNFLAATNNVPRPQGRDAAKELEKRLLDGGSFETDPFRMLKVSDFVPIYIVVTKIIYAVNEKKKTSKFDARGPFQILEAIEPDSLFMGWITIEEPDKKAMIKNPINKQDLFQSLKQFYQKEKAREDQELARINIPTSSPVQNDGWLVRIGRHSGAESVTIEGHREIKINEGKGKSRIDNHATTIWLASEESKPEIVTHCKPFGWAELCEMTPMSQQEFEKKEKERAEGEAERTKAVFINNNNGIADKSAILQHPQLPVKKAPEPEIWQNVILSYSKGDQKLTAVSGKKNATAKGLDLVSEPLRGKIMKKSMQVSKVEVEPYGNSFRLLKILEENK